MNYTKQKRKNMLATYLSEHFLLFFLCFFSVTFLIATFLFLTTGEEMIFLNDLQLPFQSSILG
ncbi:hypothetical protein VU04_11370 [Desulfobulbus sp. TB]|nr:hypothetical protein [Desulfobulbus sp. TB]